MDAESSLFTLTSALPEPEILTSQSSVIRSKQFTLPDPEQLNSTRLAEPDNLVLPEPL
jgi:hypothetical protein